MFKVLVHSCSHNQWVVAGKYHFLFTTTLTDLVLHVLVSNIGIVVAFGVAKVVRVGWMSRSLLSLDV